MNRGVLWKVAQAAVVVAALLFVAFKIRDQWSELVAAGASLAPDYGLLVASAGIVMASYVVLIWTWQHTVRAWGERLGFKDAARIWFVSNLGRYIPGKIWQIGAMGVLAQRVGISPVAAVGSALVVSLVNVIAGLAVAGITGAGGLDLPAWAVPLTVLLAASVALAPWLLPHVARAATVVLRREVRTPPLPHSAVWTAALGCSVAWLLYGAAFRCMHIALLGATTGTLAGSTAAFTASYLAGFLVLIAPGGIGVREFALIPLLGRFGIATGGAATLIVLGSRLWLTILEVLPGVLFLLFGDKNAVITKPISE